MIQIHTFKEKEKEGGEGRPQLGGQWKVPSLMALEEASYLVANGRFQCLVALGMFHVWWSMGKHAFHLFSFFPPINFT
jgi:hypothetical protein